MKKEEGKMKNDDDGIAKISITDIYNIYKVVQTCTNYMLEGPEFTGPSNLCLKLAALQRVEIKELSLVATTAGDRCPLRA